MSVMQLGHLSTRSGLTYLEVSSEVCHDSFCQLGNSVSLSWVVCRETFCLHVVSSSSCIPVVYLEPVLFLIPLQCVDLFCNLSKCILLFFSYISSVLLLYVISKLIKRMWPYKWHTVLTEWSYSPLKWRTETCRIPVCFRAVEAIWNVMAHVDVRCGELKGELANGVGNQYPSHYLGTCCIQHYYRWCAHLGCQQSTELTPTDRFKWTRPFRRKTKYGFCACAITFQTESTLNGTHNVLNSR